jgi:hypothetical protein
VVTRGAQVGTDEAVASARPGVGGSDLIGHASVIQRRLLYGGRALRTGYVGGSGYAPTGADVATARP